MAYPSDLTPKQFSLIEHLLPQKKTTRPRKYSYYQLFNAILYVLISGCQSDKHVAWETQAVPL